MVYSVRASADLPPNRIRSGSRVEKEDPVAPVVRRLLGEFGDRVDQRTIGEVAASETAVLATAKVQNFVPIIAWRRARVRLRVLEDAPTGR